MKKIDKFKKVLFINFGGIGDEILFFPTLTSFKRENPECEIDLLLEPRSASAAKLTNTIDKILTYDVKNTNKLTSFIKLLNIIRQGGYDAVISSGSNKFISLLLFLSGVKTRVGYDTGILSRKLLSFAVALNKDQYAAKMYHDLLKGVGIYSDSELPKVILDEQAQSFAEQMLPKNDKAFVVVHPGVSQLSVQKNIIKSWGEKNWAELICSLLESNKYNVVLCGGPDDETTITHIRKLIEEREIDKSYLIDLYGKTKNLIELGAIISRGDVLVCVDSAPLHLAVGLNTKIVAIFGPTDEKKLLPLNKEFIAMRKKGLTCRPCLWDKRNEVCENTLCLEISVEEVINAIRDQQI